MPISPALVSHAEVHCVGSIVAGGSGSKNTDYTFNFRRTTVVNPLSKANLDTIFQSTIVAKILLAVNIRWSQLSNTVRWLDDATDPPVPFSHVNLGAIATPGTQAFDSVYCLLRTGLRGKNYRGSKHFAGLSEVDTTQPNDDVLNAGAIALWATVLAGMATPLVDLSGNTWVLEIVSKTLSQTVINPTVVVGNDVTTMLLNKRIGKMKNRQVKSVY